MFRHDVIFRITAVEREYRTAMLAVGRLLKDASDNPAILYSASVTMADVRACRSNSKITYLVRMFAVFEESLRDVRRVMYGRNTPIKTRDLLEQFASRQHIPDKLLNNAHAVRNHRNSLVHGGNAPAISLPQARIWLCMFFGRVPARW